MKLALPGRDVKIDQEHAIHPLWYDRLKVIEAFINNGAIGQPGPLANNATTGFGFLPTMAGAPTGVPVAQPGFVPCVYDTTNHKLWIYDTAWKGVVVT